MNFFVDKQGGGFASTLVAFGWAKIVSQVAADCYGAEAYSLRLQDCGLYYHLSCSPALTKQDFLNLSYVLQPAPMLRTVKNSATLPDPLVYNQFEYERGKENNAAYFAFRKANKDTAPDQMPPPPDPHWDTYRAINPAALPGYNNLLLSWHEAAQSNQGAVLGLLFDLFSTAPNDVDSAWEQWAKLDKQHKWGISPGVGASQLYNPDQGKGLNRSKISTIALVNMDNFWLLEVLKASGFFEGAITRLVKGAKDRKTYVLAPQDIDYADHQTIMASFRETMQVSRASISSDILAAILYTESLLTYAQQRASFKDRLLKKRRPRDLVNGFHTAFYKDLGNAVATMNLAFIGLPAWIQTSDSASLQEAKEALDEIKRLTYGIDEDKGDGYTLLFALRDFVSGGDLNRFFDFTTAYASYWMGRRERGKYAHQLSTPFVETIVLGSQEES